MSFEPASPISIITCDNCQGNGCNNCDNHGIYALQDNQPLAFALPDFIDLQTRNKLKKLFWIKRTILITISLIIIFFSWSIFS